MIPQISPEIITLVRQKTNQKQERAYCWQVLDEMKIENPTLHQAVIETIKILLPKLRIDLSKKSGGRRSEKLVGLVAYIYQAIKQQMIANHEQIPQVSVAIIISIREQNDRQLNRPYCMEVVDQIMAENLALYDGLLDMAQDLYQELKIDCSKESGKQRVLHVWGLVTCVYQSIKQQMIADELNASLAANNEPPPL